MLGKIDQEIPYMGGVGPEHQESGEQKRKTHATRPPNKALESQQRIQSRII